LKSLCARLFTGIAACAISVAGGAAPQYPAKPIRLIVPFVPGGTTDIVARIVARKIPTYLGQPLVIDNRGSEGGTFGAELLAKAEPDGYTLGIATVSTIATAPATRHVRYSPTRSFTPISNIAATPNVFVVHSSFPASELKLKPVIDELKRRPGAYSFASSGVGGLGHMLMALFQSKTGTSLLHVPYPGGGPAINAVAGGHVSLMIANLPSALPPIKAKRVVAIAVAGDERIGRMLEVPTFEKTLPEVNRLAFYGLCGPSGLPRRIVDRLHAALMQTLADPQVADAIERTGSIVIGNSPAEFARQIRTEFETYKTVAHRLTTAQ
jgi:tripartite-type tricarboxylate transporter receptor subunit TctC